MTTTAAEKPNTSLPTTSQRDSRPSLNAGGKVAAIVPQSVEEYYRLSTIVVKSGLAPKGFDGPEQVMIAIMAGAELGMPPMQALKSICVINRSPSLWGDGLMAIVRRDGHKISEWLEGDAEKMVAHCRVTRADNGEVSERVFSVADAKRAGLWGKAGPWTQYPKRMLQMRARSYAVRDALADSLMGISAIADPAEHFGPERARDVTPKNAPAQALKSIIDADEIEDEPAADPAPEHDEVTGEIVEDTDDMFPGDTPAEEGDAVR